MRTFIYLTFWMSPCLGLFYLEARPHIRGSRITLLGNTLASWLKVFSSVSLSVCQSVSQQKYIQHCYYICHYSFITSYRHIVIILWWSLSLLLYNLHLLTWGTGKGVYR